MKHLPRVVLAAALAVALPAAVCRQAPDTGPLTGPPVELKLEGWPEAVTLRAAAYEQVARDVADGRRSLLEAAGLFRALNRLPPTVDQPPRDVPPLTIPIDTEVARLCRQVVAWVPASLHAEPARAAAAVAQLEAEFFADLRAHGEVRLPDPAVLDPFEALLARAKGVLAAVERRAEGQKTDLSVFGAPRRAGHVSDSRAGARPLP
jgi:hypothetical protein